ncbi:beta-propeller fold lactonase family protein [Rhodococcus sp. NPDC003318]|uniref:beta-propeller fold lactonase family protein n=1 Tax=Rhodococcus sp. NPDC003318 TaxID=3364503 RepID=UPI003684CC22
MSNDKHLGYIGELAVALGIGLAVTAPAGVATADTADRDTSSSVSSTGGTSDSGDSDSGDSDRGPSDRTPRRDRGNSNSGDTTKSDTTKSDTTKSDRTSSDRTSDTRGGGSGGSGSGTSGAGTNGSDSSTEDAPSSDTQSSDTPSSGTDSSGTDTGPVTGGSTPGGSGSDGAATGNSTTSDESSVGGTQDPGTTTYGTGSVERDSTTADSAGSPTSDSTGGAASDADADAATSPIVRSADTAGRSATDASTSNADQGRTPARAPDGTGTAPAAVGATADAATQGITPNTPGVPPASPVTATLPGSPGATAFTDLRGAALGTTLVDPSTWTSASAPTPQAREGTEARMQALTSSLPSASGAVEKVSSVVSNVLGAIGLRPLVSTDPFQPIESPAFWALAAAWCRRQEKATLVDTTGTMAGARVTSSEPNTAFAALSGDTFAAPMSVSTLAASTATTEPVVGVPDRNTGTVLGAVNASGSGLAYTVTDTPDRGSVTVDQATGGFTYTPTQAARQTAALDPVADYDSFTITVTSGQTGTPVTVQVPVSAARMQVTQSTAVGTSPAGAALVGTTAYVANQGSKSVSVLGADNTVVATVPVGTSPTGVAANPAGTRVYVTNSGSRTVSVIDTSTNKVVATISSGIGTSPTAVAVNPAGTRAYVTNSGSNTVSVIDTSTNKVVATISTGATPNAVAVNPKTNRAYVTNAGSLLSPASVSVIDTSTNKVVATIRTGIGNTPGAVAVSPDGTRVYVTNRGSNTVSAIDTATNSVIGTVAVGTRPTAVRVAPDGSTVYVATDSDRLQVIDTATRTVVSDIGIDSPAEAGAHSIAISADGSRLLITDAADARVRTAALTHVNSAPTATWTVDDPRASDGAVVVTLRTSDPDGDPVTFTVTAPGSGTVVSDGIGTLTYTPTAAARDLALTSDQDAAQFTLTASDGLNPTNLVVTVPILASQPPGDFDLESTAITLAGPIDATLVGGNVYVVGVEGFVRVIDGHTGEFLGEPIAVDWWSTSIAAAPDGDRVYVYSQWSSALLVIDTATNAVVGAISVPFGEYAEMVPAQEMVVSPDGGRLYTSGDDGNLSVFDTATNSLVSSQSLGYFTDLDISTDGRYLYGTSGPTTTADPATISVIDTETMTTIATTALGPHWDHTAMSGAYADITRNATVDAERTRLYVTYHVSTVERGAGGGGGQYVTDSTGGTWRITGGYGAVAVIDIDPASATYGEEIATAQLTGDAQGLTLSADGSLAYVSGGDGRTVTVLDTTSLTVVGTFETDTDGSNGIPPRSVLLSGDTLYVTDYHDGAVYAVTGIPVGQSAATSV